MSMRLLKVSTLLLVGSLALFLWAGVALAFTDVSDNHWAAANIKKMSERGVVGGYTDGTFRPDKTVSQVEAVCMAVRAMGLNASSAGSLPEPSFPVPKWAEADVKLALRYGLVKDGDQFSAYTGASRAWVTRLLVRMIGEDTRAQEEALLPNFTDANIIPDWAAPYVRVAQDRNLIAGYAGNEFRPNQAVSRAEMVAFLSRVDDLLPQSATGYVTGIITEITSNSITVRTDDGQSRTYAISFTLKVYDKNGQVSLSDLRRLDRVRLLADGATVTYLERVTALSGSTVNGKVLKVYPEKNTFIVLEPNGLTRTLSLPRSATFSVEGSSESGLNALRQGDEIEVTLDSAGYVITIVVNNRTTGGYEGIVYDIDLDLEPALLTLEYDNGDLVSYQLAELVNVQAEGVRFPTLLDVKKGDRVKLTREDNQVIAIEIVQKNARLDITGEVVLLDGDRSVINLDVGGVLKAYRLAPGAIVTVPGLSTAYLTDIKVGDSVKVVVNDGEITSLEVQGRQAGDSFTATVLAVDSGNRVLTLKLPGEKIVAYDVLEEARVIIDDDEESLGDLQRDMEVKVRLLDGDIVCVEVDSSPGGVITDLDEDGMLLVFRKDNGERFTYIIDDRVDVESKDGRDELDEVKRGDYARLVVNGNRVTEIHLRHTMICRVESVREVYDRIEVVDEEGDTLRLYVRGGVDLVVPGISYPDVDDVYRGDLVRVTYLGRDLDKVEVLEPLRGEITSIDLYGRSVTLKKYSGGTERVDFTSGSKVVSSGRTYDTFESLGLGDRVEVVENDNGGYTFNIMEEMSGELAADLDEDDDVIYLEDGYRWESYELDEGVYINDPSGIITGQEQLKDGDQVRLYMLRDMVYEVEL